MKYTILFAALLAGIAHANPAAPTQGAQRTAPPAMQQRMPTAQEKAALKRTMRNRGLLGKQGEARGGRGGPSPANAQRRQGGAGAAQQQDMRGQAPIIGDAPMNRLKDGRDMRGLAPQGGAQTNARDPRTGNRGTAPTQNGRRPDPRMSNRGTVPTQNGRRPDPRMSNRGAAPAQNGGQQPDPRMGNGGAAPTQNSRQPDPRMGNRGAALRRGFEAQQGNTQGRGR